MVQIWKKIDGTILSLVTLSSLGYSFIVVHGTWQLCHLCHLLSPSWYKRHLPTVIGEWLQHVTIQETWLSIPKPWCSGFFSSSSLSTVAMAPPRRLWWVDPTTQAENVSESCAFLTETLPQLHEENDVLHYDMPQRNTKSCYSSMNSKDHIPRNIVFQPTRSAILDGCRIAKALEQLLLGMLRPPKHWVVSDYSLIGKTWLDLFTPVRKSSLLDAPAWTE